MGRHLQSLADILVKHKSPPLFYAGDVFHKWNASPELVNFLLAAMPPGYAVAGNHDLPYHSTREIKRSAYWTLVQARKLINLKAGQSVPRQGVTVTAWPFGSVPQEPLSNKGVQVALIHAYCWKDGHTHPGAKEEEHVGAWLDRLRGYDGLIFGDNHQAFTVPRFTPKKPWVRNGGCFIRQTTAELDVTPTVGLVWSDGSLTEEPLACCKQDEFDLDAAPAAGDPHAGMAEVIAELTHLEKTHQDFRGAVKRALSQDGVSPAVRRLVLHYLGEEL